MQEVVLVVLLVLVILGAPAALLIWLVVKAVRSSNRIAELSGRLNEL